MGKRKGVLAAREFDERFDAEVHSLLDATNMAIEKYERLLKYWDCQTAEELWRAYISDDTCALCRFLGTDCGNCPLLLNDESCGDLAHPWHKMSWNLRPFWGRSQKARARKYAEEILRILKEKAKEMKKERKRNVSSHR